MKDDTNTVSQTARALETEGNSHEVPKNMLAALLKTPRLVAWAIADDRDSLKTGTLFLIAALLCHAVYGLAMGLFGGWSVGAMAAVKAPLVALCSLLLCFPSLYVFGCVGGVALSLTQTFMLGTSCLAMIGLLLVGLAPVAWLFSVSTESLSFVVMLTVFVWFISVIFAVRYIGQLTDNAIFHRSRGIIFWFIVFVMVSLQMTTAMRPLLTTPDKDRGWWTSEKRFFLAHFGSCFDTSKSYTKPASEHAR